MIAPHTHTHTRRTESGEELKKKPTFFVAELPVFKKIPNLETSSSKNNWKMHTRKKLCVKMLTTKLLQKLGAG